MRKKLEKKNKSRQPTNRNKHKHKQRHKKQGRNKNHRKKNTKGGPPKIKLTWEGVSSKNENDINTFVHQASTISVIDTPIDEVNNVEAKETDTNDNHDLKSKHPFLRNKDVLQFVKQENLSLDMLTNFRESVEKYRNLVFEQDYMPMITITCGELFRKNMNKPAMAYVCLLVEEIYYKKSPFRDQWYAYLKKKLYDLMGSGYIFAVPCIQLLNKVFPPNEYALSEPLYEGVNEPSLRKLCKRFSRGYGGEHLLQYRCGVVEKHVNWDLTGSYKEALNQWCNDLNDCEEVGPLLLEFSVLVDLMHYDMTEYIPGLVIIRDQLIKMIETNHYQNNIDTKLFQGMLEVLYELRPQLKKKTKGTKEPLSNLKSTQNNTNEMKTKE